ncbi:MAG: SDR family oxidoreductase [Muribaculaceae bacterium]|nr:SDR family oxidoreductase [Muribaculaceae bacterium]
MMKSPFSLKGKTILVTGASSGIGKEIAIQCSKSGANLIITGRNENRLNETLNSLDGSGHKGIIADLSGDEGISLLIKELPILDGVVLAAGFVEMWPTLFATRKRFESIFATNLFSPIEIVRSILKKKLFNPGFSIVAIDSIAGTCDFCPANGIYGAGKAALSSFLKYVAVEHASKSVRVNTISPGMILTPMHTGGAVEAEKLEETVSKVPLKRWGQPEDIAYAAIYLLSEASSYVTGTDIKVDGGYTL